MLVVASIKAWTPPYIPRPLSYSHCISKTLPRGLSYKMWFSKLFVVLALSSLSIDVASASKGHTLTSRSRRPQERARAVVEQATSHRLESRNTNSSVPAKRFASNATKSNIHLISTFQLLLIDT